MFVRLAIYLVGVLLVVAAVFVLLSAFSSIVPLGVTLAAVLLVLGLGVIGAAYAVHEPRPVYEEYAPGHELIETRQQIGDTEVRRSRLR